MRRTGHRWAKFDAGRPNQSAGYPIERARSNPGAATPSAACPNLDPTSLRGRGSRLVLRNRAPALTAAAHDNETAALSLFEQPFCSGVQGAKVTLLRVQAIRRIAKSSGPTVRGQRIDRTGNPVTAKLAVVLVPSSCGLSCSAAGLAADTSFEKTSGFAPAPPRAL